MTDPVILAAIGAAVLAALCWVATELMEDYRERQHAAAWAAMHRRLDTERLARIEARKALVDWAATSLSPATAARLPLLLSDAQDRVLSRVRYLIANDDRLSDADRARLIAAWKLLYGGGA